MNSRLSTVGWIVFLGALALLFPVGLGQLFTAWRANVEANQPHPPPPPLAVPADAPAVVAPVRPPLELRPPDRLLLAMRETAFRLPTKADVEPTEPYRIDVERTHGVTRARLDLDRDGRFDEIWTYGPEVLREVSPADDGVWTERWRWTDDAWIPAGED